jgi:ABC-type multidrug transport system fused ATPase/permease subunit
LDEGEIVEIGAHQKLINSNDIYSKLFSKQLAVDDNS